MRIVIQRVSRASVTVENQIIGNIGQGLLVLLGVESEDNQEDIDWLSQKLINLRVFNDRNGVMNLSVKDIDGNIMIVSQFTLHASTKKGNRPSYIKAARPEIATHLYKKFIEKVEFDLGKKVTTGVFGAHMLLDFVNDGPVTILIDSKLKE